MHSQAYWEARFEKDDSTHDWLLPARTLNDILRNAIDETRLSKAEVLHVGCGTAECSVLRELVSYPEQVVNLDFSRAAVTAGARREKDLLERNDTILVERGDKRDSVQKSPAESQQPMRWSCLDLLSINSTLTLLDGQHERGALFDVVVDKSTSDSIACGPAVSVRLPYLLSIDGWTRGILQSGFTQTAELHPMHILAVHLAAVTKPRTGRWIIISYSDDRVNFLPPYPRTVETGFLPDNIIKAGFPHPNQLWRLETKEKIDSNGGPDETLAQRKKRLSAGAQPQFSHWLYVLVRTDAMVFG